MKPASETPPAALLPWPEGHRLVRTPDGCSVELTVPEDHPIFHGHFPGDPLLPAVVSLGWICAAARQLRPEATGLEIAAAKFPAPIRPGDALTLRVTARGPASMTAEISGADGTGRVTASLTLPGTASDP